MSTLSDILFKNRRDLILQHFNGSPIKFKEAKLDASQSYGILNNEITYNAVASGTLVEGYPKKVTCTERGQEVKRVAFVYKFEVPNNYNGYIRFFILKINNKVFDLRPANTLAALGGNDCVPEWDKSSQYQDYRFCNSSPTWSKIFYIKFNLEPRMLSWSSVYAPAITRKYYSDTHSEIDPEDAHDEEIPYPLSYGCPFTGANCATIDEELNSILIDDMIEGNPSNFFDSLRIISQKHRCSSVCSRSFIIIDDPTLPDCLDFSGQTGDTFDVSKNGEGERIHIKCRSEDAVRYVYSVGEDEANFIWRGIVFDNKIHYPILLATDEALPFHLKQERIPVKIVLHIRFSYI